MQTKINEIIVSLEQIHTDNTVPKNVRIKVKETIDILQNNQEVPVKINQSLQELDELNNEPNIPQYIRTQIWSIVSSLESI